MRRAGLVWPHCCEDKSRALLELVFPERGRDCTERGADEACETSSCAGRAASLASLCVASHISRAAW